MIEFLFSFGPKGNLILWFCVIPFITVMVSGYIGYVISAYWRRYKRIWKRKRGR